MRINFIVPTPNMSGGIRIIATYAKMLKERGHIVTVVAPISDSINTKERLKRIFKHGFSRRNYLQDKTISFFEIMGVPVKYCKIPGPVTNEDVPDADITISCFWVVAEWVSKFSKSKGFKINFIQGYESWPGMDTSRLDQTWRLPIRKIVVSQWLQEIARNKFNDSESFLVPNSLDLDLFNAPPRKKNKYLTVGFMYNPIWCKASEVAINSCLLASNIISHLRVIIYGHNPPNSDMIPSHWSCFWNPAQEKIPLLYSSCDVWIWPSRQEGFGLPMLEAMACRTPVIGTPAGAAPELLAGGRGILVEFDDVKKIADAILKIDSMTDDAWKEMSDKAYHYARSYTIDDALELFENALIEGYNTWKE